MIQINYNFAQPNIDTMTTFTKNDLNQISSKGLTKEKVESQINHFISGFPFINLVAPATPEKGLHQFSNSEAAELAAYFDEHYTDYKILKFVPASGAASRMFKTLFEFMESYKGTAEDIKEFESDRSFNSPFHFFANIKHFAFYDELKNKLSGYNFSLDDLLAEKKYDVILKYFLTEKGLAYAITAKRSASIS